MSGAPDRKPKAPAWLVYAIFAAAAGALVFALAAEFPGAPGDRGGPRLVYLLVLLVAVGGSVFVGYRMRVGQMVRHALVWIAIGGLVILGYSFRSDFRDLGNRILGELRPDMALTTGTGDVSVRRAANGHFHVTATVDGTPVLFVIDTGATDIALSGEDARRLGIAVDRLRYDRRIGTANGQTLGASVRLGAVEVGPIRVRDIDAVVIPDGLGQSLLGLGFLDRLAGYEVRGDTMILKP